MPISHITPGSSELEHLKHDLAYSRVLIDVTNTVIAKRNLNELAQELSDELNHFFNVDFISLDVFDVDDQRLRCYTTHFANKKMHLSLSLGLDSPLVNAIIADKKARCISDVQREFAQRDDKYAKHILQTGLNHFILLPLLFGDKILGILRLGASRQNACFTHRLELLNQIAARISIGLDNALAYQEISRLKDSLMSENHSLTEEIRSHTHFDDIICQSSLMTQVLDQVEMVAHSDCSVLILGETGTGKELIARAIHKLSPRRAQTMVKMNCAAVPAGLMESDLFGHEKGAFTGATAQRIGRFELAHNGTLFLDEVGDIPLELQPKLLRVLQEREIERVGGSRVISVDTRVIAATNCNLQQMVIEKRYRSDLYYRLNVFPIVIPPLRERPEDIPLLAKFFTQKIARRMNRPIDSIPLDTLNQLKRLPWEGNVRELENVIERAVILTKGSVLNVHISGLTPPKPASAKKPKVVPIASRAHYAHLEDNNEQERVDILKMLKETNGIVAGPKGAAARLGLKRTTLLSRMQRLGISVKDIHS